MAGIDEWWEGQVDVWWGPAEALTAQYGVRGGNPPPRPGQEGVTPPALAWLQQRCAVGKTRYGTDLQTHNGRAALLDALEEAADLFFYLFQRCREEKLL